VQNFCKVEVLCEHPMLLQSHGINYMYVSA